MGERNRIGHGSRGRCAVLAACAGFAATMGACSDDSGVAPGVDAGFDGPVVVDGSTFDSGVGDSAASDSGGNDATIADAGSGDASKEASPEASEVDAAKDAIPGDAGAMTMDAMGIDATVADGAKADGSDAAPDVSMRDSSPDGSMPDANDAAPLAPLQMCPFFDNAWGLGDGGAACVTQTTSSCPDRVSNWANGISTDFFVALGSDCRLSAMEDARSMTNNQVNDYIAQVISWTMTFFGCPQPMFDGGPSTFGLIPASLWGTHVFTTADLQTLSDLYLNAGINGALSDNGSPALTADQTRQIAAQLASYAAQVPNTQTASTYSFDTCPADAGSDGAMGDAHDAATDAGGG